MRADECDFAFCRKVLRRRVLLYGKVEDFFLIVGCSTRIFADVARWHDVLGHCESSGRHYGPYGCFYPLLNDLPET